MGSLHERGVFRQRSVVFLRRLEDGREVREDFFDLKASLILPDWPARFQDSHFRYFLTNEVRDRVPAQMQVGVHWLDLRKCESFESLHRDWLDHRVHASQKQLSDSAYRLYEFLINLTGEENG